MLPPTPETLVYIGRLMKEHAGVALLPQYGIYVAAPDMTRAIDCLDQMNTNAWCYFAMQMIR